MLKMVIRTVLQLSESDSLSINADRHRLVADILCNEIKRERHAKQNRKEEK
jgi:hypothetical protein